MGRWIRAVCLTVAALLHPALATAQETKGSGERLSPQERYRAIEPVLKGETYKEAAGRANVSERDIQRWYSAFMNAGMHRLTTPAAPDLGAFVKYMNGTWKLDSRWSKGRPTETEAFMYIDVGLADKNTVEGSLLIMESGIAHSFVTDLGNDQFFSMGQFVTVSGEVLTLSDPVVQLNFTGDAIGSYGTFQRGEDVYLSTHYERIGEDYFLIWEIVGPTGHADTDKDKDRHIDAWQFNVVAPRRQIQASSQLDVTDTYSKVSDESWVIRGAGPRKYWELLGRQNYDVLRKGKCNVRDLYACAGESRRPFFLRWLPW